MVERDGRPYVRLREGGRAVFYPATKDGTKYLKPAAKWYGQYRDAGGVVLRVPLSTNKDAARLMLSRLVKAAENEKAGVVDRFAAHRRGPLAAHLDDWWASLSASGRGGEYVGQKPGRVRAAFAGCGFVTPPDLSADRLEVFLQDLRLKDG